MTIKTFFQNSQPWSRVAAHVWFWGFLLLAALLGFGEIDIPDHNQEWFLVYLAVLSAGTMMVPWLFFRWIPWFKKAATTKLVGFTEVILAISLSLSWIGSFGLYRRRIGYDTLVHFTVSFIGAFTLVMILRAIQPAFKKHPIFLFVLVVLLMNVGGIGNELFEWGGDTLFGTAMYGESGQVNDTLRDFVGNSFGMVLGAVSGMLLHKRFQKYLV